MRRITRSALMGALILVGIGCQDATTPRSSIDAQTPQDASAVDSGMVADGDVQPVRVDDTSAPDANSDPSDAPVSVDAGQEDSGSIPEDSGAEVEDSATLPEPLVLPAGLVGAVADMSFAPAFNGVVDENSVPAEAGALEGHWTVLWFYPFANTFG